MIQSPICLNCWHFNKNDREANTCEAFPDGIPRSILDSELEHREHINGDHGIQFNPVDVKQDWRHQLATK